MNNSFICDESEYLSDIHTREEELRRLNDELDLKFVNAEKDLLSISIVDVEQSSHTLSPVSTSKENRERKLYLQDSSENTPLQYRQVYSDNEKENSVTKKIRPIGNEGFKEETNQIKTESISKRVSNPEKPLSLRQSSSSSSLSSSDFDECLDNGIEAPVKEGIGPNAILRLQRARIKTLNAQLQELSKGKLQAEEEVFRMKSRLRDECNETKNLRKLLSDAKLMAGKKKSDERSTKGLVEDLKLELSQAKRELASAQKALKVAESDHRGREVRLSRALEECARYKQKIAKKTTETKEVGIESQKEKERMIKQIQSLERQRSDIFNAFKKQMKLIDILKRQKLHAEAAKVLSFTEEEFVKVLDWGT
mmetsp:Transcript_9316/g.13838  ORF Transcript_9316/g.13838 Transcript_9316/m.13838 type:complete len:366 (+) Transcript_9316:36-1133(+)